MPFALFVETDDDCSIVYKGDIHTGNFTLVVQSFVQLADIQASIRGPYGGPVGAGTKYEEIHTGLQAILDGSLYSYSNLGGNRGIQWDFVYDETINDHVGVLEEENRLMTETLGVLSRRISALTTQRNELWHENRELKRRLDD